MLQNIIQQAIESINHAKSFKEGDILIHPETDTKVEFIKFHADDGTRYLFYGKDLNTGLIKRNYYAHKFQHYEKDITKI